jgi:hypothetical protein
VYVIVPDGSVRVKRFPLSSKAMVLAAKASWRLAAS